MSYWTRVTGAIVMDTCSESTEQTLFIASTIMKHLPRITGSEKPADYHIAVRDGHNCTSTSDEFGRTTDLMDDGLHQYQSQAVLTVTGDLRDRRFEQTLRETAKMLARLASRVLIEDCSLTVRGSDANGNDKRYTFTDHEWLLSPAKMVRFRPFGLEEIRPNGRGGYDRTYTINPADGFDLSDIPDGYDAAGVKKG